ncbi:ImmA/IrrE family metallo-endopeptidase [Desulfovibrio aerotolerans]|uniref:ImmA/IrrE family metallo-endopeptidase n=1 Tax=Solidesulfovibrio aerotolerans TaxID=295255 RepID=A0A7C9N143_9BACT|nr:ImmA/IrrE family metallo-endopeptidase [Solidesulfovibrio aerotolerans]
MADKIGKTPSAVTQFEAGRSGLDIETFAAVTIALGLPPSYFVARHNDIQVDFGTCHFRANKSVPQGERRRAIQHATNVIQIFRSLEQRGVVFPAPQVPTYAWNCYSPSEIESLSQTIRRDWGMGNGPILNMAALLETKGVFVVLLPEESAKLHAFSFWAEDRPCVVVTESVSASHMQFDHGHELLHLILHMDEAAGDPDSERAANHFSGAFLAPLHAFRLECPRKWDHDAFLALKKRWHISMQAALYRARQLQIVKESSFRWGMVDLSSRNERHDEPGEFEKPLPSLLSKALEIVQGEFFLDDLSEEIGLASHEVEHLLQSQHVPQNLIDYFKPSNPVFAEPQVHKK